MEIGPNRPMSIIFLHQKYVHDPKVWPIMNTTVANDIKVLANTLLTQIETRMLVVLVVGRFDCGSFWPNSGVSQFGLF